MHCELSLSCPSVRPSVRPSVVRRQFGFVAARSKPLEPFRSLLILNLLASAVQTAPAALQFRCQFLETFSRRLPTSSCRYNVKMAGLVHHSLVGLAPAYLADDCRLLSDVGRRPLRSSSNDVRKLLVPRTHNKLGDRSFSAAGPRLWNDLPPGLRRPGLTLDSFRQSLKTHLFGDRSA